MFRLTIAVGFVIFSFPVLSESLELNMNHLPSAQPSGVNNFTYNGFDLDKEEDYFSINGSKLIMDDLSAPIVAGSHDVGGNYFIENVIDQNRPFSIEIRALVTENIYCSCTPRHPAFGVWVTLDGKSYSFGFDTDGLFVYPLGLVESFAPGIFHDFRIDVIPESGKSSVFLDGLPVVSIVQSDPTSFPNRIWFGDGSSNRAYPLYAYTH